MKFVIAIDSLKGSLSSMDAGMAIKEGILNIIKDAEVVVKPIADGGEGTTFALTNALGGEIEEVLVCGPLENKVIAQYGLILDTKSAIMEMAMASGITLISKKKPLEATTYGVGEMIKDAIKKGARNFIIGIGGSATNDGGIGMLNALGFEFFDKHDNKLGISASALKDVYRISTVNKLPELSECSFSIACDVKNPLCGENGATYIYGLQKGVTRDMMPILDRDMRNFAEVTKKHMNNDFAEYEGSGAAGGLGFAFLSYLNAELKAGIDLILDRTNMAEELEGADFVFTGEGRLDEQTSMGKAPVGIAKLAKKKGATVIALSGTIMEGAEKCNENGIDAFFPILRKVVTLDEAVNSENARENMVKTTEQIVRLIATLKN